MAPCQLQVEHGITRNCEEEATIFFILMSGKSQHIAGRVSLLTVHLNLRVIRITVESSMMGKHFSKLAF
jgi:hypothetical protein